MKRGKWRVALGLLVAMVALGFFAGRKYWQRIYAPITAVDGPHYLLVPTGADMQQVMDSIAFHGLVGDTAAFRWTAERKKYPARIKPGRYRVDPGMSAAALVDRLRSGEQEPVRITFNNVKRMSDLAAKVSARLECPEAELLAALEDPAVAERYGFRKETFISMFIPDTYEFWWNTSVDAFLERMHKEHDRYWTEARKAQADKVGLSPVEVTILASIVQAETGKRDDAPKIAGVYLNRLRIGMPLQADPTLKFALGADSIARVLDRDKLVDSPYNTYRNTGLPPGPINMPERNFLQAVLEPAKHDHLYFCARADLSGYSEFARTYDQHLVNARKYQRALDQRGIYR
ncbi:MAG: endolytic transglycosylase MltG [Flavobacteriales bacterium]|nr:endolytic transglycosylase MltG [Flavobacteriales bacterium]